MLVTRPGSSLLSRASRSSIVMSGDDATRFTTRSDRTQGSGTTVFQIPRDLLARVAILAESNESDDLSFLIPKCWTL